jgi:hypothetical protein
VGRVGIGLCYGERMGGFDLIARAGVLAIGLAGAAPSAASVIVIDHTPERIIVATDSRGVSVFGGTGTASISDGECKVFALGSHAAFVIAGHSSYIGSEPNDAPTWSSQREAQRLFDDAVKESGGWNDAMLEGLALSWRASAAVHMDRLRHANLKQFRDAMGHDIKAQAVFATAAGNSVRAVGVEVTLTKEGNVTVWGPTPTKCGA